MRPAGLILGLLVLLAVALRPGGRHLPLDPDEPIAADGSSGAGQARTIFDVEPLLGAFGEPKPPDPDDPTELRTRADLEQRWADNARDAIGPWLYRTDWRLCEEDARVDLIAAVRLLLRYARTAEDQLRAPGSRRQSLYRAGVGAAARPGHRRDGAAFRGLRIPRHPLRAGQRLS